MAITFKDFQSLHESTVPGRARKIQSDVIMDATFTQDIQYQVGYFFDYYHCSEENRLRLEGFDPEQDTGPIPIDIKFIAHTKRTLEKDEVSMHIQFRPNHECAVDYYKDVFERRYNARYPVGLYCFLKGEDDIYRRWLVVSTADRDENQYPTWDVLMCDDVFRWIKNGKYYEFPGVSRSQNSYNSGLWTDYRFTQVEDQAKFCLPLNRDTETLFYNTYLVIDANVLENPRVWQISKVNRSNSKGIAVFTVAQDLENQHTTKAEYDEYGNVTKWWADWDATVIPPMEAIHNDDFSPTPPDDEPVPLPEFSSYITCSGKPQIRIGGSAKTFTVTYKDADGNPIENTPDSWTFYIEGNSILSELLTLTTQDNKVKVKFLGDDSYIGKIFTVKCSTGDVTASLDVEILAL